MMTEGNGSTGETQNSRRLDKMQDVIQSMITLVHEESKLSAQRHTETIRVIREAHALFMEEVRELIILQKEHRIDIMALFHSQKNVKERLDNLEGSKG
ncbi:MAG: hypothetical protein JO182_06730 [Acidobacteriaceae bacterium]|nr:hypothetical protein [Acidobacteriaceae bacterium]MBV9225815.1 hypothetical protein [Acidobacteriaceae bacterium]